MGWEEDVRYNIAERRAERPTPYHEMRKWKRLAWFWFVVAATGWWLVLAIVTGRGE